MMMLFVAVLAVFIATSFSQDPLIDEFGEVIYVNLVYRHGERNPWKIAPNDPHGDVDKYWPEGLLEMTKRGILEQHDLGKWIRQRYQKLLPDDWRKIAHTVKVYSTEWDRNLLSAQAQLSAMFPIEHDLEEWEGLKSYPVTVQYYGYYEDKLLDVTKECKRLQLLMANFTATSEYQELWGRYANLKDHLEKYSGFPFNGFYDFRDIFFTFSREEDKGLELPSWAAAAYPNPLSEAAVLGLQLATWTEGMRRLKVGPLIKVLLGNFRRKLEQNGMEKMSTYSAQDATMVNLLNTMGVYNKVQPQFSALIMMELRRPLASTTPHVLVWYKNSMTKPPHLLTIPGCETLCPLTSMEALLHRYIPENWEEECKVISKHL